MTDEGRLLAANSLLANDRRPRAWRWHGRSACTSSATSRGALRHHRAAAPRRQRRRHRGRRAPGQGAVPSGQAPRVLRGGCRPSRRRTTSSGSRSWSTASTCRPGPRSRASHRVPGQLRPADRPSDRPADRPAAGRAVGRRALVGRAHADPSRHAGTRRGRAGSAATAADTSVTWQPESAGAPDSRDHRPPPPPRHRPAPAPTVRSRPRRRTPTPRPTACPAACPAPRYAVRRRRTRQRHARQRHTGRRRAVAARGRPRPRRPLGP